MRHLIVSREYPPAAYPPGGIGTYVRHISRLLAEAGETVHVIGQQWEGAPKPLEEECGGRLLVHRVPLDQVLALPATGGTARDDLAGPVEALGQSEFPPQLFAWQSALLAEHLVAAEGIDLIEGQDYEAPLYYLQLRRALGLGPSRRPPCVVHFHSPTELIFRYNDWDLGRPDYFTAKRLEDYSITAADAHLCPSRYLARQTEQLYRLRPGSVEVIPYPVGETLELARSEATWERGTICYVGRTEPRKGVIEWVDAAVAVARERPGLEFEFVGADTPRAGTGTLMVQELLEARIPPLLRGHFRFLGVKPRAELAGILARARLAVVSSRWENFPNTCIEAMGSGLPVLASPHGGMTEMIEDDRTGWIAESGTAQGLATALRRALDTDPAARKAMGAAAARAIRRTCNNAETIARQVAWRASVASRSGARSFAAVLPRERARLERRRAAPRSEGAGPRIGLVVEASAERAGLEECIGSVLAQSEPPAVVIVADERDPDLARPLARVRSEGWRVLDASGDPSAPGAALAALSAAYPALLGVSTLRPTTRLAPQFVARVGDALEQRNELGLISFWTRMSGEESGVVVRPCPGFPYQLAGNDVAPTAVYRVDALREIGPPPSGLEGEFANWQLANAVLARGWVAITYPEILARHHLGPQAWTRQLARVGHARMYELLLAAHQGAAHQELDGAEARDLAVLLETTLRWPANRSAARAEPTHLASTAVSPQFDPVRPGAVLRWPIRHQLALLRRALGNPGYAARWLVWHGGRATRRALDRLLRSGGAR
ncbi:MAG: glycosyltransferase family 4 protein [Gemmatimonadales bacterium]